MLVASNAESSVWRMANDMLVGRYPVDNGSFSLAPERLGEYVGVFRESRYNAWTFVAQDGRLYIRSTGQPFIALTPSGPDTFNYGTRGKGVFEREGGKVKTVRWLARGGERPGQLHGRTSAWRRRRCRRSNCKPTSAATGRPNSTSW